MHGRALHSELIYPMPHISFKSVIELDGTLT